jgi:hypothetical protein
VLLLLLLLLGGCCLLTAVPQAAVEKLAAEPAEPAPTGSGSMQRLLLQAVGAVPAASLASCLLLSRRLTRIRCRRSALLPIWSGPCLRRALRPWQALPRGTSSQGKIFTDQPPTWHCLDVSATENTIVKRAAVLLIVGPLNLRITLAAFLQAKRAVSQESRPPVHYASSIDMREAVVVLANEIRATSLELLSWAWWAAIMVEEPLFGPLPHPPVPPLLVAQFLSAAALLLQPSAGLVSSLPKDVTHGFAAVGKRKRYEVLRSQGCDGNRMIARYDGRTCPPGALTPTKHRPIVALHGCIDQLSKAKRTVKRGAANPLHQDVISPRPVQFPCLVHSGTAMERLFFANYQRAACLLYNGWPPLAVGLQKS